MEWAWWAIKDLNLGPLACEASALTTELIAHEPDIPVAGLIFGGFPADPAPKFVTEATGIFNL